jgi:uncharacterized membrane protein
MQQTDNKIIEHLGGEEKIHSWLEEDRNRQEKIKLQKKIKKEERYKKYNKIRSKLAPNLDYFAGEKILDKVGIAAFLAGLAFFINISMQLDWINAFGRLFFGILFTIIFLISGYLLRKKYLHFSNIMIGGGIASFIFSIFAAYYQYHIIHLGVWTLSTIIILSSTIIISVSVKRHEIALITFVAAYIAPFTVNFVSSDYIILFSYLTMLNIGILIYDFFQKSIAINILSFGFTFLIYGVWLINLIYFKKETIPYLGAFLFLTLYYIIFLMIILMNNVRKGHEFKKIEFSILMTAKAVYLSVGMIIISKAQVDYQGLFMGLIAIINYTFFLILYPKKNFDRRILNLFLALSIMFFTLIIPVQFYGKTITMVWSLQAFVLMFVALKSKLESMRQSSFFLTIGMIGSLFYDMYDEFLSSTGSFEYFKPFLNENFFTSILSIVSIIVIIYLLSTDKDEYFIKKILKVKTYQIFLAATSVVIFYLTFFLEIKYWALQKFVSMDTVNTVVSVYNFSFLALASIPVWFSKKRVLGFVSLGVSVIAVLAFIFYYSEIYTSLRNLYLLSSNVTKGQFITHYFAVLILIFIEISAIRGFKIAFPDTKKSNYLIAAVLMFFVIYTVSFETSQFFTVKIFEPHLLIQNIVQRMHRFSYTIVWTITTFLILITGFIFKSKEIRSISILMYFLILIKIFTFDLLSDTDQDLMISFTVFGIFLLMSSFIFHIEKQKDIKQLQKIEN